MKHLYQLVVCILFTIPTNLLAQDEMTYGAAEITTEYCVTIDTSKPIEGHYVIDITHLELASEKLANDKFGFICNNLLTYSVNLAENKAYLEIHLDRTPEPKDVNWWNDYIQSLCGL